MIRSFVKAMWLWARGRFNLLPQSIIDIRWSICEQCPHKKRGWFRYYCDLCKCTISKKRHPLQKLSHPCQECPLLNWSKFYGIGCDD